MVVLTAVVAVVVRTCVKYVGSVCLPPHHTVAHLPARFPADPFFYEFFLTHPVFISLDHLCSILKATYSGSYQYSQENVTQIVVVLDDGSDEEDVDAGKGEDSSTDATKRK